LKEEIYDDELLKFLLTHEPVKFQGFTAVRNKFVELFGKEQEKQARLQMTHILPPKGQCKAQILPSLLMTIILPTSHYQVYEPYLFKTGIMQLYCLHALSYSYCTFVLPLPKT